jgi:hypothetical protein
MHSKKDNSKRLNFIQGLRPFSSTVPHGLKKKLRKGGYNFSNIVDNWTKMVGKDMSKTCYPNTVRMEKGMNNGTVILNVVHGNEMHVEYSKKEIIDKINNFFGYNFITQIKLKIIHEKKEMKESELNNKQNNKKFENKLKNLENNDLRNSLNKLVEAYNEKNN